MKPIVRFTLLASLFWCVSGCLEEEIPNQNLSLTPSSHLEIRLTDDPGEFQEVNVDIQGVEIKTVDGWLTIEDVNTGIYNLLTLTDGVEVSLVDSEFPSGEIFEIRLILGENNSIKVDDEVINLQTPGAQQSGLKIKIDRKLEEESILSLLLDFDAAESVIAAGSSGKFILRPVIRVFLEDDGDNDSGNEDDEEDNDGDDDNGKDDDGDTGDDNDGDDQGYVHQNNGHGDPDRNDHGQEHQDSQGSAPGNDHGEKHKGDHGNGVEGSADDEEGDGSG